MEDPNWQLMEIQRKKRKQHLAPCMDCLRELTLHELNEYVCDNEVDTEEQALHACFIISRKISAINGCRSTSVPKIRQVIHNMRKDYVNFRKFTKIPGVVFVPDYNYVEVNEVYTTGHQLQETEKEKKFREESLLGYGMMHLIFRKKKFPLFEGEPQVYYVDPRIYSDSSEDEED